MQVEILFVFASALNCTSNGTEGKAALLQKSHLFCAFCRVCWGMGEFLLPYLPGTRDFITSEVSFDLRERFSIDTMALQFRKDAVVSIARCTPMDERFGKPRFREEFCCFQLIQQGVDIIAFLGITGKLVREFEPTVFPG